MMLVRFDIIMKILAMYLPQYHEIKENNEWWGEGYTEWNAVKNAKKLFKEHIQPRVPLNNNYYDLSDENAKTWKWQANLAEQYGVYGFCIYHYWFGEGKQLLEKPMEILLKHPEIKINYCVCWANHSWRRTWYGVQDEMLMEQKYGDEREWEKHFYYLLQFFKDKRYIKIDNMPVINIYHSWDIECLKEMRVIWDELAKLNGFNGVYIVSGNTGVKLENRYDLIDAFYNFEPSFTLTNKMNIYKRVGYVIKRKYRSLFNKMKREKMLEGGIVDANDLYDINYKCIARGGKKCYLGTFPQWDDTPRRQYKGMAYISDKNKFKDNLIKIRDTLRKYNREDDFVYINAWNEWGEGAYLEPDENNRYSFLESIKNIQL